MVPRLVPRRSVSDSGEERKQVPVVAGVLPQDAEVVSGGVFSTPPRCQTVARGLETGADRQLLTTNCSTFAIVVKVALSQILHRRDWAVTRDDQVVLVDCGGAQRRGRSKTVTVR